ncbi:MAG: PAS domain-containing protein [Deltaproteobacteria bacterium]|nr:PAS domain-containing protein [Deltaproteobacteria bacterium]
MIANPFKRRRIKEETLRLRQEVAELKKTLDLERRKRAEDDERDRIGAIFRRVYDQAPHPGGIVGLDGTLQHANLAAGDLIGIDPSQFIGLPFWETPWWTHSAAAREQLRDGLRRAAQGELVQFETTH